MDLSEATDGASLRSAEAVLMECIQTAEKFGNRQFFLFFLRRFFWLKKPRS